MKNKTLLKLASRDGGLEDMLRDSLEECLSSLDLSKFNVIVNSYGELTILVTRTSPWQEDIIKTFKVKYNKKSVVVTSNTTCDDYNDCSFIHRVVSSWLNERASISKLINIIL